MNTRFVGMLAMATEGAKSSIIGGHGDTSTAIGGVWRRSIKALDRVWIGRKINCVAVFGLAVAIAATCRPLAANAAVLFDPGTGKITIEGTNNADSVQIGSSSC